MIRFHGLALGVGVMFWGMPVLYGKPLLYEHAYNVYSQHGEDGIIAQIFSIIGTTSKVCIEFGAWDGFYLSNTANLWTNDPTWKAVLIEADKDRFNELVTNVSQYACTPINAMVGVGPDDSLEALLNRHNIPDQIDLLSIDIDGNDYYILESLAMLRPRVIICEHNPTMPVTLDIYADYSPDNNLGASVGALARVAAQKGYVLVALTDTNAFFVLQEYADKFEQFETDSRLLDVNDYYVYVIASYDGKFAVVNKRNTSVYGMSSQYPDQVRGAITRCCQDGLPALQ